MQAASRRWKRQGNRWIPPWNLQKEPDLPASETDFGLPTSKTNYRRITMCGFKPLILWQFVTPAIANQNRPILHYTWVGNTGGAILPTEHMANDLSAPATSVLRFIVYHKYTTIYLLFGKWFFLKILISLIRRNKLKNRFIF